MNLLSDIITYIRRIIKSPSNVQITDNLLIDYVNRFWIMDVDARIQLFDLKTKYQFQTVPGVDQYNMPLYSLQTEPGSQNIAQFPVYQGFTAPAFVQGVLTPFFTTRGDFYGLWPGYVQQAFAVGIGDGSSGPYQLTLPFATTNPPAVNAQPSGLLRGHVDINGIISSGSTVDPIFGSTLNLKVPTTSVYSCVYFTSVDVNNNNLVIADSGQFLAISGQNMNNYGLLMWPGSAPFGNAQPTNGYTNTFAITGASNTNPVVLNIANANFAVNQLITIQGVGGMTELNGKTFTVTAVTPTTVTIDVNGIGFGIYTSGGTASSLSNVINYQSGSAINVFFSAPIPAGQNINAQYYIFQPGLPRAILFYNNILTLRSVPNTQYLVELDAYLSPAAFLNTTSAIPFGYMAEYIARGAARKILSDTGDVEQFQFYEPFFREQEYLVWKRSQRQFTSTRTETLYSQRGFESNYNQSSRGV